MLAIFATPAPYLLIPIRGHTLHDHLMKAYLLDSDVISNLHSRDDCVREFVVDAVRQINGSASSSITAVTLGELSCISLLYGKANATSRTVSAFDLGLASAKAKYEVAEADARTGEVYAGVKATVAYERLDMSAKIPRWVELWEDRNTKRNLQVDGDDLWTVAIAIANGFTLVTCDKHLDHLVRNTTLVLDCVYVDTERQTVSWFQGKKRESDGFGEVSA